MKVESFNTKTACLESHHYGQIPEMTILRGRMAYIVYSFKGPLSLDSVAIGVRVTYDR